MKPAAKLPIALLTATPDDAELLTNFGAQAMRDAFGAQNTPENLEAYLATAFTPEQLRRELTDPGATFFLAKHGPDLVGYAKMRRNGPKPRRLRGMRAVEVQRIYVRRDAQGLGIGRVLLEACLDTGRSEGFEAVYLGVWEKNPAAQAFYRNLGFSRIGWHFFQFGSERQRDFWMSRPL
jgi:ribosomal protein S18 acetylase RimI-like enzyme